MAQPVKVKEERVGWDDLLAEVKSGAVTEAFACGTAAVIGPITQRLFDSLRNIQYGVEKDPFGWVVKV